MKCLGIERVEDWRRISMLLRELTPFLLPVVPLRNMNVEQVG